jgi:phage terminase large subunit-like protein
MAANRSARRAINCTGLLIIDEKAVRANSIRGRMELDGLYFPTPPHWYVAFLSKLLNFPAGTHNDQLDEVRFNCGQS